MRKIQINIGRIIDVKANEDPKLPEYLNDSELYWRLGTGCIGGKQFPIERKKCLGEFEYRMNGQILNPKDIESWSASEWFDWRDS